MSSSRNDLARMMPDAFRIFFAGRQPYSGQAIVMPEVVRGNNVLFAAPTASGKTEASIAPLYQRHISFRRPNLSTIYVAPTKALVNDLYERLVTYLDVRQAGLVTRYTGDRHEFSNSAGGFCLLTTPEALDSLQLRRPEMLASVRAVVIDEIHLLHGQPRGQQLRHVISRIRTAAAPSGSPRDGFQLLGMTATLDDMASVAEIWLGEGAKIVSHGRPRDIEIQLISIDKCEDLNSARARALAQWLKESAAEKVLIFTNSRNGAHALAASLHRELKGTRWPVHLHFGALAAAERERIEDEMRAKRYGVCVATTTLEIGIDIGDVDFVVLGDAPKTVSGFLQRIGRGNRRSGICKVIAFRASDDDERVIRALVDCGRCGQLDDTFDYDRPSVRFQQILSLCWRATREDRPLSMAALITETGADGYEYVIHDMIEMGCLNNVRGALIPCDRLMDEADAGRIHTVITGQLGGAVVDTRTGKTAIRDADESTAGGAIFHGGAMRRLVTASEGGVYLGEMASSSHPLARIRGTGPAPPMSRSVIWGLARQQGFDPARWQLDGNELVTWGGEIFNTLLAAIMTRNVPNLRLMVSPEGVTGQVPFFDLSLTELQELARTLEMSDSIPLAVASKFTNPSKYLNELSASLSAKEKRNSIPWKPFLRWLQQVQAIEGLGSNLG